MIKNVVTVGMVLMVACGAAFFSGCESDAGTGALLGTAAGAGIGALAGGDTEATLIGGAIGGGAGYIIGNESDKRKTAAENARERDQLRQEINTELVNVTNSNGSIIQVQLKRSGVGYVGPRGEYYPKLPTSEDLRPVYGF